MTITYTSLRRTPPHMPKTNEDIAKWERVVVVLDGCPIEIRKHGAESSNGQPRRPKRARSGSKSSSFTLVNSEQDRAYIQRHLKADFALYRPDILHQCLLQLQESPLNRSGRLEVYLRIQDQARTVVKVHPYLRPPIHYEDFAAMMVELMRSYKIRPRGYSGGTKYPISLLKIVRSPFFMHLPEGCPANVFIFDQHGGEKVSNLHNWVKQFPEVRGVGGLEQGNNEVEESSGLDAAIKSPRCTNVFIIGAFGKGTLDTESIIKENEPYGHPIKCISIHDKELPAATCCSLLAEAYERSNNV